MVDDPCWRCQSLEHALPYGSKLPLSPCSFDLVDFELDEVCDCNGHLGDYDLAVEHLEEVGEVGERPGWWVKRLEAEARVPVYSLVEDGARYSGGIEREDVRQGMGGEAD